MAHTQKWHKRWRKKWRKLKVNRLQDDARNKKLHNKKNGNRTRRKYVATKEQKRSNQKCQQQQQQQSGQNGYYGLGKTKIHAGVNSKESRHRHRKKRYDAHWICEMWLRGIGIGIGIGIGWVNTAQTEIAFRVSSFAFWLSCCTTVPYHTTPTSA